MKRVVVIGAGPAGLAALRSLLAHRDQLHFVAYETSDRVGGTWILDDSYKPTSMYKNLRTDLPKEAMAYPGFPFSPKVYQSFIGHKDVLEYLESFTLHYKLHEYIKFRHKVVEVDAVIKDTDKTQWNVTVEDCENGSLITSQFDFVLVCNGHYTVPLLPDIEGQNTYKGEIVHSHHYRSPLTYKDKTVLVLGAGPSGIDISVDLSPHVSKVFLSHNKERLNWKKADNIVEVAGIERIYGDDIILKDNTIVHADVIILATGYRYSFPFLSKKCHPVLEENDRHVANLYKLLVDINHPSLFYIGLNQKVLPFPHFSYQSDYAAACITGVVHQVSREVMENSYKERRDATLKKFGSLQYFNHLFAYQWEYDGELAAASNAPLPSLNVSSLVNHVVMMLSKDIVRYKDAVYRLNEDGENFTIISEPELS